MVMHERVAPLLAAPANLPAPCRTSGTADTVPLATHLKLKGQLREFRTRCAVAEARVQSLQTALAEVLQGVNHGEKQGTGR